ncbi:MAG: 8-amino-7-oxononanoate synthase [Candidatus Gastranaerophilaceae bacterium]|jgi:8-amino-7-oxononanoate synthase
MQDPCEYLIDELKNLSEKHQLRNIKNIGPKTERYLFFEKNKYLNLSSNNYLGIADNQKIIEKFYKEVLQKDFYSFGSASSRLLTGNTTVFNELEDLISKLYSTEKTLLFNSGYQANIGIVSSIVSKKDVIFSDKLNHASIIDGMKLSEADFYRYKHLDYENLEELLIKHRNNYRNAALVTESLFSMDGDIADIKRLVQLKNKYGLMLIIDEAHAFGLYGENGLGISENQGLINDIDLIIGTFGKTIGSTGAFVSGKACIIDYLLNKARSFIFSTALPPVNIAFSKWVLENIIINMSEKRKNLIELSKKFKDALRERGIKTVGESQIIPIIIGENKKTLEISEKLLKYGYWVLPIRPPTVPEGASRLRISLTSEICWDDIKEIPSLIREC